MALIDWEGVVLELEGHVLSKNTHGQRELLAKLAELRVRHRQIEGLPEKALRLYGPELADAVSRHDGIPGAVVPDDIGGGSPARSESTTPEKDRYAQHAAVPAQA
jgi:hypothetical protein